MWAIKAKLRFLVCIVDDGEHLFWATPWRKSREKSSDDAKRLLKRLATKYGHCRPMLRTETKPDRILGVDYGWKTE